MRLESFVDGGAIVHHNSKSSLVVELKSKLHLDLALMDLKESVIRKLNESFSIGGWCVKVQREILCSRCRWVEGSDPRSSTLVLLLNSSGVE